MSIISGYKKFKKHIKTNEGFQLQSLWTNANTVEADDKRTMQTKVGAINGISSSETANSGEIAASTALTNKMNGSINQLSRDLGGLEFAQDATGNWGYKIGGADPVIPFNHFSVLEVPLESNEFSLSLNFAPKFIAVHVTNVSQKILGYSGFTVKNGVSSGITAAGSILNMDVNFEGNKISVHVPIFVRESGHKYTVVIC